MYRVIIVEDDPMVASINRKYVEASEGFSVTGMFKNGLEALEYLKTQDADLVILDYFTPQMNGADFIDRLHAAGKTPSIIMVTSANSTTLVKKLMRRGVTDYLVKPFEYERFQAALERYRSAQDLLADGSGSMNQAEIDRLIRIRRTGETESAAGEGDAGSGTGQSQQELPKGLNGRTLEMVRGFLREHGDQSYTSENVASLVGVSRITVRRYLNYMVESGELDSRIDYHTGGRPGILYRWRKD